MNYKYKIKVITGFRKDQIHSIDANEAHKAYYLFLHPEQRGVFDNGLALKGSEIQKIMEDYHGTMGWNPTHELDNDDWDEIRSRGVDRKLRDILNLAQEVAKLPNTPINKPLILLKDLVPKIESNHSEATKILADKFRI